MNYEIKHRYTGAVLYAGGSETLRDVVEAAVRDGARLDGARLDGASLVGASLDGARLDGASLDGASLVGASLDGARLDGSRSGYLFAYLTDAGIMIRAGCFFGTLDEFRAACDKTHGDSTHGREYAAAIQMTEAHASLWTPAEVAKEAA